MANDDGVPEYLKDLMMSSNQNRNETWNQISEDFEDYRDTLLVLRPQTKKEAEGKPGYDKNGEATWTKAHLEWVEPKMKGGKPKRKADKPKQKADKPKRKDEKTYLRGSVKPWFEIPYTNDEDFLEWRELLGFAKELAEKLQPFIDARSATIEFAGLWGAFCSIHGQFLFAWNNRPTDIARLRGQAKTRFQGQREWYAKLYVHLYEADDSRSDVDGKILDHVHRIINEVEFFEDAHFQKGWFKRLLGKDNGLAGSLSQTNFSEREIRKVAKINTVELPPLDLENYPIKGR